MYIVVVVVVFVFVVVVVVVVVDVVVVVVVVVVVFVVVDFSNDFVCSLVSLCRKLSIQEAYLIKKLCPGLNRKSEHLGTGFLI